MANQIASSLKKAGGDALYESVYETKVKDGQTVLTEIHHRQTPHDQPAILWQGPAGCR